MDTKVTVFEQGELDCINTLNAQLHEKIELVANAIGALKKDGRNTQGRGYPFISHEAMTTALRPLLLKYSLSIIQSIVEVKERDLPANSRGVIAIRTTVKAIFTITDTETGHQVEYPFYGADQDYGGKSLPQAITQAQKYFFFKTFKVTDKESDGDYKTTEVTVKTPPKKNGVTISAAIQEINKAKSGQAIKTYFEKIKGGFSEEDKAKLVQACVSRNEAINKVEIMEVKSDSGKKTYKVSYSIANGWGCSCPATRECKHIKTQKVIAQ